jgi:tetratricopeptide (TPR) repeat protein
LAELYQKYLVGKNAQRFAAAVAETYTSGTLQRLAAHRQREIRRAAVLALTYLGDYDTNHTLGRALLDDDRIVRTLAENGIRNVWNRAGNEDERRDLSTIIRLNAAQHYRDACRRAAALIDRAAWYAEAWNQRGVAQFHLEQHAGAIRDCHQALELNPYHFPAAALMGQAYLKLGNHISALESFRRALRLNPDLEGVRAHVVRLAKMVEGK